MPLREFRQRSPVFSESTAAYSRETWDGFAHAVACLQKSCRVKRKSFFAMAELQLQWARGARKLSFDALRCQALTVVLVMHML
jgi:hypothetical protein